MRPESGQPEANHFLRGSEVQDHCQHRRGCETKGQGRDRGRLLPTADRDRHNAEREDYPCKLYVDVHLGTPAQVEGRCWLAARRITCLTRVKFTYLAGPYDLKATPRTRGGQLVPMTEPT